MYIDMNILDVMILNYYILINGTSFESLSILVVTIIIVISELFNNNSELFGLLYTLIYVGAVIILFVFILSILNKKEEYEYEYNSLYVIILILLFENLDIIDNNNINIEYDKLYNIKNILYINNNSELSVLGNILLTEYLLIMVIIGLLLLISIIGLIIIVLDKKD